MSKRWRLHYRASQDHPKQRQTRIYVLWIDLLHRNIQLLDTVGKLRSEGFVDLDRLLRPSLGLTVKTISTSNISISSLVRPVSARILGTAATGEIPIYRGSTPMLYLARLLRLRTPGSLTNESTGHILAYDRESSCLCVSSSRQDGDGGTVSDTTRVAGRCPLVSPFENGFQLRERLASDATPHSVVYRHSSATKLDGQDFFCEDPFLCSLTILRSVTAR